ncbi:unnamed protein product [Symbiodinium natans]|uniref:Uncharacterized protein n=1 Tax=Symbiodinium natans TaxID=878477 RepID=A0A812L603_9DINO|nr:unnamed protein product [Symbiodinium natans]
MEDGREKRLEEACESRRSYKNMVRAPLAAKAFFTGKMAAAWAASRPFVVRKQEQKGNSRSQDTRNLGFKPMVHNGQLDQAESSESTAFAGIIDSTDSATWHQKDEAKALCVTQGAFQILLVQHSIFDFPINLRPAMRQPSAPTTPIILPTGAQKQSA